MHRTDNLQSRSAQIFQKSRSRHKNLGFGRVNQVPYLRPTDSRRYSTKFICYGNLMPEICASLSHSIVLLLVILNYFFSFEVELCSCRILIQIDNIGPGFIPVS
jgi:hypothetical protein